MTSDNYQHWLARVNQACGNFRARPLAGPFIGELESSHNGGLKMSTVSTAGVTLFRTRNEINSSNDGWFYAVFQLEGEALMEQHASQTVLQAGDMTVIDSAQPCAFYWQRKSKQVSLMLPRHMLEIKPRTPMSAVPRLAHSQPLVQISQRLLQESLLTAHLNVSETEAALQALVCLLRPLLLQQNPTPHRREALFHTVVDFIDAHIQSESLRPEWIARENGMSLRSLYRMFAAQGLVVAQFIKHRRLDFCAQQLRQASSDEKLAGIGYDWGFTDQSHFSTAFKQRFGMSPGEYRKRSR